jgi:hypothetical protein
LVRQMLSRSSIHSDEANDNVDNVSWFASALA